jgi:hypothetical protein
MKDHGKWSSNLSLLYYITGFVYHLYQWFLILGGVSFIAGGISSYFKEPILTGLFVSLGLAGCVLGLSFGRRLVKLRHQSHNPAIHLQKTVINYDFIDPTSVDFLEDVTAKIVFPVEYYEIKFNWSGLGKVTGEPVKNVLSVEVSDHQTSVDNICRVHFSETLPTKQIHHFIYKLHFSNATKPIRHFLGRTVYATMAELTLRVKLLPNHGFTQYKRQFFISCDSNLHLWEQIVSIDNPQEQLLEWTIPNPQNYYYRISW